MTLLHLQPEQAREAARRLRYMSQRIRDQTTLLGQSTHRLAAGWNAPSGSLFLAEAQAAIAALNRMGEEVQLLSTRVERKISEWEMMDRQRAAAISGLGFTPEMAATADGTAVPSAATTAVRSPTHPDQAPEAPPADTTATRESPADTGATAPDTPAPESVEPDTTPSPDAPAPDSVEPDTTSSETIPTESAANDATGPDTPEPTPTADSPPGDKSQPDAPAGETAPEAVEASAEGQIEASAEPTPPENYEGPYDNMGAIDQEIKELEGRNDLTAAETDHLEALREERQQLQESLRSGIPGGGLSDDDNPFPRGECTWYATSRRNLYPHVHGHAKYWAEQALAAGQDVGSVPVQGSVMVWQPGVFKAHAEFGHVSYVERVERLIDGSFKVFFTDNDNMSSATPRNVTVEPGQAGVAFIY